MAAKKKKKGHGIFLSAIAFLLVLVIAACVYWYFFVYKKDAAAGDGTESGTENDAENGAEDGSDKGDDTGGDGGDVGVISGDLSIHFLELGNKYAGDCTLIKTGNTEVLIDAGSRQGSAAAIVPYLEQYCTDGEIEYVIATHAHQDHIAAFVGTTSAKGVFESFTCGTIIDFPRTNQSETTSSGGHSLYGKYVDARNAEVEAGAKHYTALECVNEENGAKQSYALGEGIEMTILYQKFYETKSSDENNYSVCMLLTQGENHFLFTGDLEKEGEESLTEENDLPHCKLFKGGHHGSRTSSNEILLKEITPEIVCICCCAGAPEYSTDPAAIFPTQEMIDRVARYTKEIYVTSLATDVAYEPKASWNYTSMNGNITVLSTAGGIEVQGSNNSTILKETEWFKQNRTWPSYGVQ